MPKYTAKMRLKVVGYVECNEPIESESLEELVDTLRDWRDSGGDDEPVEIDWDSSADYEVIHVWDESNEEVFDEVLLQKLNNSYDPLFGPAPIQPSVDQIMLRMKADRERAEKLGLVLVRVSARRFAVVKVGGAEGGFFHGSTAYGPSTKEMCEAFIQQQT
jgi:hypothetical protein